MGDRGDAVVGWPEFPSSICAADIETETCGDETGDDTVAEVGNGDPSDEMGESAVSFLLASSTHNKVAVAASYSRSHHSQM